MALKLHVGVRDYLNAAYAEMGDPNGSLRSDFQGRGFHARLFELACFAYLRSTGVTIERGFLAPDFMVTKGGLTVAIEVTTANTPQDQDPDVAMTRMGSFNFWDDSDDFEFQISEQFAKRMAATLRNKLKRQYQNLPHVSGKPIVLMVAPFFEPGSVFAPDFPLLDVLYPTAPEPAGAPLFWLPEAATISAVAYCNSFTVPKFLRLSDHDNLANNYVALRTGLACDEDLKLKGFRYQIGHSATPVETWSEGVTLFFNPLAINPLPPDLLPATSKFVCQDDMIERRVQGFHPLISRMRISSR